MSQRCSQTLVDLFESGACLNAEGEAVIYDDGNDKKQTLTYSQLISAVHCVRSRRRLVSLYTEFILTVNNRLSADMIGGRPLSYKYSHVHCTTTARVKVPTMGLVDWGGGMSAGCRPQVELFADASNCWPHSAPQYH